MYTSYSSEDEALLKKVESNNKQVMERFARSERKMIGCVVSIPLVLFFWILFSIHVQSSIIINVFPMFILFLIAGAVKFIVVSNKIYKDYVDLEYFED